MKIHLFLVLSLCFCITGFSPAFAADEKPMDPQMQAMMKAWADFATPGAPHKMLAQMVGTWDTAVKSYMDPAHPEETKGTSTFSMVMDGRYLQEVVEGTFGEMPFHGMGTYGYDNLMKKYYGTWVDTMGTGIMFLEGTSNDGGKTVEWTGKSSDPMTGKQQSYRSVAKMVSNDQYTFEMYGPGPDGKEAKAMEMTYTRRK